jgi:hypothetical protein
MKRSLMLFWLVSMVYSHAHSQKEGDAWMIGYSSIPHPDYSLLELDFLSGDLHVKRVSGDYAIITETCSTICDKMGNAIVWTNGMEIRGPGSLMIEDTISYFPDDWINTKPSFWKWWYSDNGYAYGFPFPGGAIILPDPGNLNQYYLIYLFGEWDELLGTFSVSKWLSAKVKHEADSTFKLIYKDSLVGVESAAFQGPVNAVRHANGRDWWLISFIRDSQSYQLSLLDHDGLHFIGLMDPGIIIPNGSGLATISPMGNYMAIGLDVWGNYEQFTYIFNIDRCNGQLTFRDSISTTTQLWPGFGFSPSEKYLYTSSESINLWQFDMEASDIGDSRTLVGVYDGFVHDNLFATTFGPIMQTPDGRLYVVPTSGSNEYLHVIDRPDEPGTACKLKQHAINLTVPQGRSAPNVPNYRLGPIDGSPCDTLGLDNKATSRWRWEVDEPNDPLTIRFTDLSFYEPDTWDWDFDDDQHADIPSPIHTFPDYGLYHVCQTVENQYQRDSTCQWIELMPTVSVDDPKYVPFSVVPNPFTNELRIQWHGGDFTSGYVIITDLHGREVYHAGKVPLPITLEIEDLPAGMYICTVRDMQGGMTSMKVVKRDN